MTTDERRTHMWQAIVRHAFEPNGVETEARWLHRFNQSVLLYVDNPDPPPRPNPTHAGWQGRFGSRSLLVCEYVIGPQRSEFNLLKPDLLRPDWHAQFGVDVAEFEPSSRDDVRVDEATNEDISVVLRGMVDHPRLHLHIYEDAARRELRIGTGLAVPFLFLFQLRHQLCLDSNRRADELARLRDIFTPQWFRRRKAVSPEHLFGVQ
jgi:hypothetical protein